ncbi:MAG: RluA family pseudouridine synthase [Planctomycetota bacterium]|jgi:23S rRNA pseudouridine1911/1915/1917 synthase
MDTAAEPSIFLAVDEGSSGVRLDRFLADRVRECSRTFLQRMIRYGNVSLNGGPAKPSATLKPGDKINLMIVEEEPEDLTPEPEDIPLDVVWEDADIIVVNKPPGMASHPSMGHTSGTLVNALLHYSRELSDYGSPIRPGIVHRLDLDTSGLLVVAKNNRAHRALADQFKARETHKEYRTIAHGVPNPSSGTISTPIARGSRNHKRMRTSRDGKAAVSDYRTLESFKRFSYLAVRIHSGRTHQIRVHLASRGHPVLCDGLYGREVDADEGFLLTGERAPGAEAVISRQALHATRLSFRHPSTGMVCGYEAPIPEDMRRVLDVLGRSSLGTP